MALSAAWLFSAWFTKPLRQLSSAARQMALGNYAVQVDSSRRDELGDLAQDFNHMASEVQHAARCSGTCWPTSLTTCAPR